MTQAQNSSSSSSTTTTTTTAAANNIKRVRTDGLETETIARSVDAALQLSLGGRKADRDERVAAAAARNRAFAEKYPKLLEMACSATTPREQEEVRGFLRLMLDQVDAVERGGGAATLDSASVVVGQAMADRYLPKQPPSA
jgi:hypothetical protein